MDNTLHFESAGRCKCGPSIQSHILRIEESGIDWPHLETSFEKLSIEYYDKFFCDTLRRALNVSSHRVSLETTVKMTRQFIVCENRENGIKVGSIHH